MIRRPTISAVGVGALVLVAGLGPRVVGPSGLPSVAASAVQLLGPGTRIAEAGLEGGGFVRGLEIDDSGADLRVRSARGWRTLPGVRATSAPRHLRLWLGSDHQGRSLLARVVHGARTSLWVGVIATAIAIGLGTAAGLISGLAPVPLRRSMEAVADALLGLPRLLLLLLLGVVFRDVSFGIGVAIGLASWMEVTRLVQARATELSARPFVAAARGSGAGRLHIAVRHVGPNLGPVLAVSAPLVATQAILLEATLSFLGVAGGTSVSWGRIVADGRRQLPEAWWLVVFPGALLCFTALAIHGLAEEPRDSRAASRSR